MGVAQVKIELVLPEESVPEIKLDDMASPVAAPDAVPLAAVQALPRAEEAQWVRCDSLCEGEQRRALHRDASAMALLWWMNRRGGGGGGDEDDQLPEQGCGCSCIHGGLAMSGARRELCGGLGLGNV